jgi:hypothetical protein
MVYPLYPPQGCVNALAIEQDALKRRILYC